MIIPIAAMLKIFFCHFFVALQSMTMLNLMPEALSYQDLYKGVDVFKKKYPGADRIKTHCFISKYSSTKLFTVLSRGMLLNNEVISRLAIKQSQFY